MEEEEEEKPLAAAVQGSKLDEPSPALTGRLSPWSELRAAAPEDKKPVAKETGAVAALTKEDEELAAVTQITRSPRQQVAADVAQGCIMETNKSTVKGRKNIITRKAP